MRRQVFSVHELTELWLAGSMPAGASRMLALPNRVRQLISKAQPHSEERREFRRDTDALLSCTAPLPSG